MTGWRPLLFAILVYVGLDLCLPNMPGAFVFDPDGSVESVDVARARPIGRIAILASPPMDSSRLSHWQPGNGELRPLPRSEILPPSVVLTSYPPRAICAGPPASEDSH